MGFNADPNYGHVIIWELRFCGPCGSYRYLLSVANGGARYACPTVRGGSPAQLLINE
jgi:hypothetical protein